LVGVKPDTSGIKIASSMAYRHNNLQLQFNFMFIFNEYQQRKLFIAGLKTAVSSMEIEKING
jgi:hypothetical protein